MLRNTNLLDMQNPLVYFSLLLSVHNTCIVPSVWQRKNINSVMSPIFIEILKGSVKYAKNLSSSHMGYYVMKTEK